MGHEALGGKIRAAEVAARQAFSGQKKLSGYPEGAGLAYPSSTYACVLATGRPMSRALHCAPAYT